MGNSIETNGGNMRENCPDIMPEKPKHEYLSIGSVSNPTKLRLALYYLLVSEWSVFAVSTLAQGDIKAAAWQGTTAAIWGFCSLEASHTYRENRKDHEKGGKYEI